MKILWITNTIFPAPSKALGISTPVVGGWMYGLAKQIAAAKGINLAVAATYSGKNIERFNIENVIYYLLPVNINTKYQKYLEKYWLKITNEFKPDIVHIHGTEFTHGLACMRICPALKYIVSIQGLVSAISRYYYSGINKWDIFRNITFRDVLRFDTIFQAKKKFEKRGKFEKEYIQRSNHVIGRTSWDYAHTKAINQSINYHFCNETLRDSFYTEDKWDINTKTDYTIFLSKADYPIKGLHQVLKAIAILKQDFPEIQLRIAGKSIIRNNGLLERIKLSGYGSYINGVIKKFELEENICFTGLLNEKNIVNEYKNAHIFICPSSIENSSNSVGEAQILGVPTIGSYVGGIPDMIENGVDGFLYRFEEIEMLAYYIRKIFSNNDLAKDLSKNGINNATRRHNSKTNLNAYLALYIKVYKQN